MSRVRRAFLMSSLEQYLTLVVNFAMIAVLARLLAPAEIGVAVVGMGIAATVFSLREFGTPDFLIQQETVRERDMRTAFTINVAISVVLGTGLAVAAHLLSGFYHESGLQLFLLIMVLAAVIEATASPSIALLRREMAFGTLARIRSTVSVITAAITVALASSGYGYMSYAWGLLAGAVFTAVLVHAARPAYEQLRPSLASWRSVAAFGRYRGATGVVEKIYETIPQLLLGRLMPMSSVAFYNRANAICGIPDRLLLSSVFAVAFPALAEQVREGKDVRASYLRVLSYISAVYWPALVVLAVTADAVVDIILGPGWTEVTPLVRILSLAAIFWFPVIPTNPLLLAMGRNRDAFVASFVARGGAALILCTASFYGIVAMALSQFIALPFQMTVALRYARRHVAFAWSELIDAVLPSAVVTLSATVGPLAVTVRDGNADLSAPEFALALVLAAAGWLAGMAWTRHPFLDEVTGPLRAAGRRLPRLRPRASSPAAE